MVQPPVVQVDIPVLNKLVNVFPLEIQEEDLMNDEELQNLAALEGNDGGLNLFVGGVQLLERSVNDLFEQYQMTKSPWAFSDPSGLWGNFFAPSMDKAPTCLVPSEWANFFTAALLTPKLFCPTKEFLTLKGLL